MNPRETIAHHLELEAAEAADGPHVRTWSVYAAIAGSKYLGEAKAATAEAAIEAAYNLDAASISLCHVCADEVEDPEVSHVTVVSGDEEATDDPARHSRAADGSHAPDSDPVRVQKALRLWELVERYAEIYAEADLPSIEIFPPCATDPVWELDLDKGVGGAAVASIIAPTLAEAVEAALAELGRA